MGVYAEISFADPPGCPVGDASTDVELFVVDRTSTADETRVTAFSPTEEFHDEYRWICRTSNGTLYRFVDTEPEPCPCDLCDDFERTYTTIHAHESVLNVGVYAPGRERLERLVDRCRSMTSSIRVHRLVDTRSVTYSTPRQGTTDALTERQNEVLSTAYDIGYYSSPRRSNLNDVAERLDIHYSTVRQHLVAAEEKIIADVFTDDLGGVSTYQNGSKQDDDTGTWKR